MALWDNYDDVPFHVVVNAAGQRSVWPASRPLPGGWAATGFAGPRPACLEEIDRTPDGASAGSAAESVGPAGSVDPADPAGAPAGEGSRGPQRELPDVSIMTLIRTQGLPEDRVAATSGTQTVTRGELLATAADWARALTDAGCGREVPVALLLPRGLEALTAILAVLEAGGAYVPLSCDDPPERILAILEDCGAPIAVTTPEMTETLRPFPGRVLTLADLDVQSKDSKTTPAPASGEDLAYIFYTSGTTGEPKGVEGTHSQLVNYALWCRKAFAHRPGEITFLSASLFFLGSLTTIFTPLLEGWPIVVVPDGATTDALLELSQTTDAGLLKLTPTHIRMMTARGVPEQGLARQLMVGSEPLTFTRELHDWMAADRQRVVVNHYGLTETHGCFCHWLTGTEEIGSRVPIGAPIDNVVARVVDRDGEPVPVGEIGELLVGGPSLGRGYRRRPGLTAERWIPDPWATAGERLLRTGDLARRGPDGLVTVLGRADRQVKIRGHRVEPAAVEEVLRGLPGVKEALVLPRSVDGTVVLDAFLIRNSDAEVDAASVRDGVAAMFPPPWVPARYAIMAEFPVNANGKVDTRALPEPQPARRATSDAADSDRWSRTDRLVAEAFCQVLDIEDIGLRDDFYDLGGDSAGAVEVAVLVGEELGRDVPVLTGEAATVRGYARAIAAPAVLEGAVSGAG